MVDLKQEWSDTLELRRQSLNCIFYDAQDAKDSITSGTEPLSQGADLLPEIERLFEQTAALVDDRLQWRAVEALVRLRGVTEEGYHLPLLTKVVDSLPSEATISYSGDYPYGQDDPPGGAAQRREFALDRMAARSLHTLAKMTPHPSLVVLELTDVDETFKVTMLVPNAGN